MSVERVKIWDGPVRLVHWALVALIGYSWWSGKEGGNAMTYHMWSGYAILTLVVFRVLWGFVGSSTARFASFVRGPCAVVAYLRILGDRRTPAYPGHNPLGGWSVVLMLVVIGLQAGTGLFANDDIMTEGPLVHLVSKATSDLLTSVHYYNFYVLLTLAGLHVAAVLFYLVYKSENLIGPMITGSKRLTASVVPAVRIAGTMRALAALAVAAGFVYLIVRQ